MNFETASEAVDEMTRVAQERLADVPGTKEVQQNLLQKAQVFYQGFLEENRGDPAVREEVGRAYRRLGEIHHELAHQFEQAEQVYRNAIAVFEELAGDYPDVVEYREEIVLSQHGLINPLKSLSRQHEAEQICRQALIIAEKLAADSPDVGNYRQDLSQTHFRLGLLLYHANQREEAEQTFRQSEELFEKLAAGFCS